jgi:hypothetical protein
MKPQDLSSALRSLAYYIKGANNPSRSMVASGLRAILSAIDPETPAERLWGKPGTKPLPVERIQLTPPSLEGFIPPGRDLFIGDAKWPKDKFINYDTINNLISEGILKSVVSYKCELCGRRDPDNFKTTNDKIVCQECESASKAAEAAGEVYPPNTPRGKEQDPWSPERYKVYVESKVTMKPGGYDAFVNLVKGRPTTEYDKDELDVLATVLRLSPSVLQSQFKDEGIILEGGRSDSPEKIVDTKVKEFVDQKLGNYVSTYSAPEFKNLFNSLHSNLKQIYGNDIEAKKALSEALANHGLSELSKSGMGDIESISTQLSLKDLTGRPLSKDEVLAFIRGALLDGKKIYEGGRLTTDPSEVKELWFGEILKSLTSRLNTEISGILNGKLKVSVVEDLVKNVFPSAPYEDYSGDSGILTEMIDYLTAPENGAVLKKKGILKELSE